MVLPVSLLNYQTISPSYWLCVKCGKNRITITKYYYLQFLSISADSIYDVMAEMCLPVKIVLYRLHCGRYLCVAYSGMPFLMHLNQKEHHIVIKIETNFC